MSPAFPPEVAASWLRVRRYAVPGPMIERATGRRLAGDWRGACAAANVDVLFELPDIAAEHGPEIAAAVEADLGRLAPDLVRWHLPRVGWGRTTLGTEYRVLLAEYGRPGPRLYVQTPGMVDGPQRLRLGFGTVPDDTVRRGKLRRENWTAARHLWSADDAHGLRERWVGPGRPPFTDRAEAESLHDAGKVEEAFAAAGIGLDLTPPRMNRYYPDVDPPALLANTPLALTRLEAEARARLARDGGDQALIYHSIQLGVLLDLSGGGLRAKLENLGDVGELPRVPQACWQRPPDLELLRLGRLTPDELHPLVRASLFPGEPPAPAAEARPVAPVRVRCKGEWHEVSSSGSDLRVPHTEEERRREDALKALGGEITGCFAVRRSWNTGTGWLPKGLREQRRELFNRIQHGDTDGVVALLDAGADPRVRDGRQRTLLHLLHMVDFEPLLPRLLDAGLDLEAHEQGGRTPLHLAVGDWGSAALVRALIDAGARIDVADEHEVALLHMIKRFKRTELDFLAVRLEKECPDVGYDYWSEYADEEDDDDEDEDE